MRLFKSPDQEVANKFLYGLEKTIELESKPYKKIKSTYYKPSALNCMRMMYFYRTSTEIDEVDRSSSSIGILESGQDRHLRIQNAITKMKANGFNVDWINVEDFIKEKNLQHLEVVSKKEYETTVHHKELDLLFLCDGLVKINNNYYIIEIKTENSSSFFQRNKVAEEHKHQATCYCLSFKINNVIFIYENRDYCSKKAFLFTVDQSLKNEVIGMIERCNEYVLKKELPFRIENKACNYCDYRKRCKELK